MLTACDPCLFNKCRSKFSVDASGVGIGSVLSVTLEKQEHPVAHSRMLSKVERNYSVTELQGVPVVTSIQHFMVYLLRTFFTVDTDHRTLLFLQSIFAGFLRLRYLFVE